MDIHVELSMGHGRFDPGIMRNFMVSSIRTPKLILGRLERIETNLMHSKCEVT